MSTLFGEIEAAFGMVPNLFRTYAHHPPLLRANWEKVKKLAVEIGESPTDAQLATLSKEAGFTGDSATKMAEFLKRLYTCFDNEDAQYVEINPVVQNKNGELVALDAVTLLYGDAKFRHKDWTFSFAAEFGRAYTSN